jgi:hypothetical protein
MMIRNILILTVLVALVPMAMSNVSASADSEIALFSTGSLDSNGLSISGNGDSAKMELKATNDNGKSNRVSGFQLTADSVLSIEAGDKVTVKDNVDFTKAVTTDATNNQKAIGITSNGVIDFTGYTQGVYTLDVVVDDDRAYEAIIAIGDQTNQVVDKEITRVNSEYTIEFAFPPIEDPKPPKCNEGEELINGKCEPIGLPYCDLVSDDYKGGCFDRTDNDEGGPFSCRDGSRVEDWRDCKDAEKHPDEVKRTILEPTDKGYIPGVGPITPEPEPVIGKCFDGATPVDGKCPNPTGEPACDALGCPGSPPDPGYEPLVPPEEAVVPQPVFEEVDDLNIDEIELDEETTGEDEGVEVEEIEEESGETNSEGSEESGGSEDKEEDEGSEQESQGNN